MVIFGEVEGASGVSKKAKKDAEDDEAKKDAEELAVERKKREDVLELRKKELKKKEEELDQLSEKRRTFWFAQLNQKPAIQQAAHFR